MRQNKTQNKWLWIALAGTLVSVVGLSDALFRERGKRSVAEQKLQSMTVPADPSKPGPSVERSAETPPGTASAVNATSGTERRANPPLSTEYIQVIEETRAALEGVRKELSAARNDLETGLTRVAQEKEAREKMAVELNERTESLAAAKRVFAATDAELKSKNERLGRLETSEKLVREAAGKAEVSVAKALRSAQELEDLNRRRELLLASINRRYREVTDQYRTLSLRVQGRAEQLGLDPGAGELSRIQTSVQQAEEEMRQLNGLSAQAAKLLRNGR